MKIEITTAAPTSFDIAKAVIVHSAANKRVLENLKVKLGMVEPNPEHAAKMYDAFENQKEITLKKTL